MKKIINGSLALIPAVLVAVLIWLNPFYSLDTLLCDVIYSRMNGTGDTIKLICVDEKTLEAYGPFTSWSREKSAELIEKLYANQDKAPQVLAFDFMFCGDGEKSVDDRLAKAAEQVEHMVVATDLVYRGKTQYDEQGIPYYESNNIETEDKAFETLDSQVSSGFANTLLSKDGFVRTAQLHAEVAGEKRYSFATEIYREYLKANNRIEEFAEYENSKQLLFFYSGKPGEFIHYSMKDVLDGNVPAEAFQDSVVLVGAYAAGLQDAYHSAAKRGQDMNGVEINANIVRALMLGKTAQKAPVLPVAIILALVIGVYTYLARVMKMYPALLVGVWTILAIGIAGRILAGKGYIMSLLYPLIMCALIMIWVIIEKYVLEIIERRKVLNSFRKYMAPQVIDSLSKDGSFHIELGGEKRHVAVLFVDIRGFTSMSEAISPEQVVQILNQYLTLTTSCIFEHGGMLDKFVGDATMAIFNAPNDQDDYVYQAILTGLAMQKAGRELGEKIAKEFGRDVSFGVGINVGEAIVGNIGCETRMDYTAIGDTVNTAARLEGKAGKGEVLISEQTYKMLEGRIEVEFKEEMQLKGKKEPVKVYNVLRTIQ